MRYSVGIDIGGTNTRIAVINEDYRIVERVQFETDVNNPESVLDRIKLELDNLNYSYLGVGLSCPGPLNLINGIVLETPNLHGDWWNYPVATELSTKLGCPVYLENDANLAALAEAVIGEGKDYKYVQFLTISTGLGSGLVVNKEIYIGAHGFAHEIANICLWKDGPSHGSIYPGGIEAICSGTAIVKRARSAGLIVNHAGEVNQIALEGNSAAIEIMTDAKEYLANALAMIYAFIDPQIIILGGSVALKIKGFVEEVEELTKQRVFECVKPLVKVRKSTLNEDSGLLGAGILAFRKDAS